MQFTASQEFIQRRRAALERFLNRSAAHPVLRMDPDFRDFLEMDELPRAKETQMIRYTWSATSDAYMRGGKFSTFVTASYICSSYIYTAVPLSATFSQNWKTGWTKLPTEWTKPTPGSRRRGWWSRTSVGRKARLQLFYFAAGRTEWRILCTRTVNGHITRWRPWITANRYPAS